jgi:hypothetical protein
MITDEDEHSDSDPGAEKGCVGRSQRNSGGAIGRCHATVEARPLRGPGPSNERSEFLAPLFSMRQVSGGESL